jgi:ABC-type bacteriocin/lantibiotic exporter with double-glycine peptidase domain
MKRSLSCLFFVGILVLTGCGSPTIGPNEVLLDKPKPATRLIQNVPFFPQEDFYCGPSALAGLLTYYGHPTTQNEIADEIFLPRHFGTLSMDLLLYSQEKGLDAKVVEGNMNLLKSEISQKRPVIVFLNLGLKIFPKGHFITVIGYDDPAQAIIAHSGRQAGQHIAYHKFLQAWEKTGFWMLLVDPKPAA